MFMFTSPRSDAVTVLLWGDAWWISGADHPIGFGSADRAATVLLGQLAERRTSLRLRLIYQGDSLASVPVNCPNGGRSTVGAALEAVHPTLADPACAWGFDPIFGCATLLHCETAPGLLPLVRELEAGGVEVEGAWPLGTVLNLVPEDWPENGALTVAAVAAGRALEFRHRPDGTRDLRSAQGEAAAEMLAATVQEAFEREDAAFYVVALDPAARALAAQAGKLERPGRTDLGWPDLVRAAATLSRRQPNQLLPAREPVALVRAVEAVAVATLVAAYLMCLVVGRDYRRQVAATELRQAETVALRAEVAELRGRAAEAAELTEKIRETKRGRGASARLLESVGQAMPAEVVVTRLKTDRSGFVVEGRVVGSAPAERSWRAWLDPLRVAALPWRLEQVGGPPQGGFVLQGGWL